MSAESNYEITVLFEGYSKVIDGASLANCTCTLIKGPKTIIVDTMTAWDGPKLLEALQKEKVSCDDIDYVICTHGHSDHVGCNHLFQRAVHIVGFCISHGHVYFHHDFNTKPEYIIDDDLKIVATPGHTLQDVTILAKTKDKGIVAVTGDLFECEEDLKDDCIWKEAGSDSERLQQQNRNLILGIADWIIPGHGAMFKVTKEYRNFKDA